MAWEHKARVDIYERKKSQTWIWIVLVLGALLVIGAMNDDSPSEGSGSITENGEEPASTPSQPALAPIAPPAAASKIPVADIVNPFVEDVAGVYAFSRPASWYKSVGVEGSDMAFQIAAWRDNRTLKGGDRVSVNSKVAEVEIETIVYYPDHQGVDLRLDTADVLQYIADDGMKVQSQVSVMVGGTAGILTTLTGRLYDGDNDGTVQKLLTVARPQGLFMMLLYYNPQDAERAEEIFSKTMASVRFW